jgi:hypothetical protein
MFGEPIVEKFLKKVRMWNTLSLERIAPWAIKSILEYPRSLI